MAKTTIGQKAYRTATLLVGLRTASVARHLKPFGLTDADVNEGWQLFLAATGQRIQGSVVTSRMPSLVRELDAFEDHWFPIAKIVLARHYPTVMEHLFVNLARANGRPTTWTVQFFLQRLAAMEQGQEPFGAEGPAAREILRVRGLSDEIVAGAQALVEQLHALDAEAPPDTTDADARKEAEDAMWRWYLEWSGLVRKVITDGNLLRMLGFKKRKAGARGAEAEEFEDVDAGDFSAASQLPPQNEPLALPAE
jgi:predicted secreted protein